MGFWLPAGKMTLLLQTPEIKIYASPLQGPHEDLQWFDRFYISELNNRPLASVAIRRAGLNKTLTQMRRDRYFEQLEIKIGKDSKAKDLIIPGGVKVDDITMSWGEVQHSSFYTLRSTMEYFYVETPSIYFHLVPAHAGNEFADDYHSMVKYTHMDFMIGEMKGESKFGGVLPELWGLKPRARETTAMLTKPSLSHPVERSQCDGNCSAPLLWFE